MSIAVFTALSGDAGRACDTPALVLQELKQ